MTINFLEYKKDTINNLKEILKKLSSLLKDFGKYEELLLNKNTSKKVIFIGGAQISGSISPFMHTYSSFLNNNFLDYILFDMTRYNTSIESILEEIKNNEEIKGANVTMPYKVEVFKFLEKYGELDNSVKLVGAVNTIVKKDGKLVGLNTDIEGILIPIKEKLEEKLKNIKRGYILGAGGAARASIGALLELGVDEIFVFNRTEDKLNEIKKFFNNEKITTIIYDQTDSNTNSIKKYFDKNGILINTLPFGFKENLPKYPIMGNEIDNVLKNISLYFEIVYNLEKKDTPMSNYIKINYPNIYTCDGIDMVVSQAKKGFELWSNGDKFRKKELLQILRG